MTKRVLLFCFVLLCSVHSALADTGRATVRLDARALFQVDGATQEAARERADAIEKRLNRILETPANISPVTIATEGERRILSVAGRPVVEISPEDATEHLTDIDQLAVTWRDAIDGALTRGGERRTSTWRRFSTETQASVETAFARMLETAITVVPRLLAGVLVLLLFWAFASAVRWITRLVLRGLISDLTVENLIKQITYYSIWAIGIIVATSALGFDPQALATGLGLTGVALGFALKDILSNFVSGLLILLMRPFEINDQIVIGPTEGSVERILLRATQIRTYDGRAVLVPNSEVFTSRVTNNTESPVRRGSVAVPVGYEVELKTAVETILDAALAAEGVLATPAPTVRITELQDSIHLEARFWADSRRSDFVLTASNVRRGIVQAFRAAGIGLPEPGVRVLVPRPPDAFKPDTNSKEES
ncbi:mechanosensitive ion channel family protein [Halopseudomonas nanhaiensis]|uniref:mechanosensitive ion channel family protein n=1 Tax=Halopseudomonas nanhaiensis TaxID=2830842 RepID=UPI001CBAF7D9|nr:mechanosensitive ion channel family protein [Halopseudomonas nanhaiensis]UAW96919.1 mechanosensitive ion channel family protein [Halopseudomonas nanhaiensis]